MVTKERKMNMDKIIEKMTKSISKDSSTISVHDPKVEISFSYIEELKKEIWELRENNKKLLGIIESLSNPIEVPQIDNNLLKNDKIKNIEDLFNNE